MKCTYSFYPSQQCTREANASDFSPNITADCIGSEGLLADWLNDFFRSNNTEDIKPDVVHWAYFRCSMAVWFIMPLLSIVQGWNTVDELLDCQEGLNIFLYCLLLPIRLFKPALAYVASAFFVYLYIPVYDMYLALLNLCGCERHYAKEIHENLMPVLKIFEQIGEAVPQLCIAATFYTLNWHWLSPSDKMMGMVTMTLSTGSVMMGLVKAGKGMVFTSRRRETQEWNWDMYGKRDDRFLPPFFHMKMQDVNKWG